MIINLIDALSSLIATLIITYGIVYGILFFAKEQWIRKKRKREVEIVNKIQLKMKGALSFCWLGLRMLIAIILSVTLAIGTKPIIYKLNYMLGEGYATFASYVIAICLYTLLYPRVSPVHTKENDK